MINGINFFNILSQMFAFVFCENDVTIYRAIAISAKVSKPRKSTIIVFYICQNKRNASNHAEELNTNSILLKPSKWKVYEVPDHSIYFINVFIMTHKMYLIYRFNNAIPIVHIYLRYFLHAEMIIHANFTYLQVKPIWLGSVSLS